MTMAPIFWCIAAILFAAGAAAAPLGPDGIPGRPLPGKFVWFDLATEDPASARAFYGSVFGWKFRAAPGFSSSYLLIESEGRKVGGLFRQSRPAGAKAGARWLSLVSVPDATQVAAYVRKSGGQVVVAPVAVPGRGTHAVFRDPEGALFGVMVAEGDPADAPVVDGEVFWLDFFSRDPAKAAAFYAGLAGFEVSEPQAGAPWPRWILGAGGFARAGVVRLKAREAAPGWLPYVLVSDVPERLRRAQQAGGRVVVAPRAELLDGRVAVLADPNGGLVGIVDWETRVAPGEGTR